MGSTCTWLLSKTKKQNEGPCYCGFDHQLRKDFQLMLLMFPSVMCKFVLRGPKARNVWLADYIMVKALNNLQVVQFNSKLQFIAHCQEHAET